MGKGGRFSSPVGTAPPGRVLVLSAMRSNGIILMSPPKPPPWESYGVWGVFNAHPMEAGLGVHVHLYIPPPAANGSYGCCGHPVPCPGVAFVPREG